MIVPGYAPGYVPGYNKSTSTKCRFRSARLFISPDGPEFRQPGDELVVRFFDGNEAFDAAFPIYNFFIGGPPNNLELIVNTISVDFLNMGFALSAPDLQFLSIEQSEGSSSFLIDITCNNPMLWTEIKLYE